MECVREANLKKCACTYEPCKRKGACCQCLTYHQRQRQHPACCFSPEAEATYDRSFEHFARLVGERKV